MLFAIFLDYCIRMRYLVNIKYKNLSSAFCKQSDKKKNTDDEREKKVKERKEKKEIREGSGKRKKVEETLIKKKTIY